MLADTVMIKDFESHSLYREWSEDELKYLKRGN